MAIRFVEALKGNPTGEAVVVVEGEQAVKAHYQRDEDGNILIEFDDHHEIDTQYRVRLQLSEGNKPEYDGFVHDGVLHSVPPQQSE